MNSTLKFWIVMAVISVSVGAFLGLSKFYADKSMRFLENVEKNADKYIESAKCKVDYKGLHYDGFCIGEVAETFGEFVLTDIKLDFIYKCRDSRWDSLSGCINKSVEIIG